MDPTSRDYDIKLLALGMEPDCTVEWQVLSDWADEEEKIDKVCDAMIEKYVSTPATAAECLKELEAALLAIGVEPDRVGACEAFREYAQEKEKIDKICDAMIEKYRSTPATAKKCIEEMEAALLAMEVEPDRVAAWEVFSEFAQEEEEWDSLTAEEQAGRERVPKGKKRKRKARAPQRCRRRSP